MGLDALLARLEGRPVTSVTSDENSGVTLKPAPAVGCTPVTPVTAITGIVGSDSPIEGKSSQNGKSQTSFYKTYVTNVTNVQASKTGASAVTSGENADVTDVTESRHLVVFGGSVTCGGCRHFQRIDHPHLGRCGAGEREDYAGLWDDDRRGCHSWESNKAGPASRGIPKTPDAEVHVRCSDCGHLKGNRCGIALVTSDLGALRLCNQYSPIREYAPLQGHVERDHDAGEIAGWDSAI